MYIHDAGIPAARIHPWFFSQAFGIADRPAKAQAEGAGICSLRMSCIRTGVGTSILEEG